MQFGKCGIFKIFLVIVMLSFCWNIVNTMFQCNTALRERKLILLTSVQIRKSCHIFSRRDRYDNVGRQSFRGKGKLVACNTKTARFTPDSHTHSLCRLSTASRARRTRLWIDPRLHLEHVHRWVVVAGSAGLLPLA